MLVYDLVEGHRGDVVELVLVWCLVAWVDLVVFFVDVVGDEVDVYRFGFDLDFDFVGCAGMLFVGGY